MKWIGKIDKVVTIEDAENVLATQNGANWNSVDWAAKQKDFKCTEEKISLAFSEEEIRLDSCKFDSCSGLRIQYALIQW